jgi:hypothetical protein
MAKLALGDRNFEHDRVIYRELRHCAAYEMLQRTLRYSHAL